MDITLKLDDNIVLELTDLHHAAELHQLVGNNRQHLREWLPWVDRMLTLDDFKQYLEASRQRYANHGEMAYMIMEGGIMIGRAGIHNIDLSNKTASIGYWLHQQVQGKGIITRSCKLLLHEGFTRLHLNRIEIRVAVGNVKSQAIPEKLGFKRDGILRQAEFVNNHFVDLNVFSMLKDEWLAK